MQGQESVHLNYPIDTCGKYNATYTEIDDGKYKEYSVENMLE